MKKALGGLTTLGVIVFVVLIGLDFYQNAREFKEAAIVVKEDIEQKEAEEKSEAKEIAYSEISKAYEENGVTAEEEYGGNYYILTDKIYSIDAIGDNGAITLETEDEMYFAYFDDKEALKGLKSGEEITIVGECNNGLFYHCEIK